MWTARPGDILPSSQFCHSVYLNLLHLFESLITPPDVLSVNYSSTEEKKKRKLSLSLPLSPSLSHPATLHSNLQTEPDRYTFPGMGGLIECEWPV